jgi:predicted phosphodiesterase
MKIALVSDLHLEFSPMTIKNESGAEVLILAGDICISEDLHDHPPISPEGSVLGRRANAAANYRKFFASASKAYEHVIYVAGNHEFYHGKWVKGIQILREESALYGNIHFLERDQISIKDVTFVGGTLWTDMNKVDPLTLHATRDMMNDFSAIRDDSFGFNKLKPEATVQRHNETLQYFGQVLAEQHDRKFVIVGHHAPTPMSISPKFKSAFLMNGAFASDLSEFILDRPQIKAWVHGHMHNRSDYCVGDTRVICNPRGYPGEYGGFDVNFTFEV